MNDLPPPLTLRHVTIAVGRAIVVLVIWLALFLATFLGYLTVPVALIAGFLIVWGLADVRRLRWLWRTGRGSRRGGE
jgi:hypothetical protein